MIYDKEKKCYLIKAFTESHSYEGDSLSTDDCPLKREYCRRQIISPKTETLLCDRFIGTCGDDYHKTYPTKPEDHNFRILCKGPNSMEFIVGED